MIGDEYNEKSQKLKIKIEQFLQAERKWINKRAEAIDNSIEEFSKTNNSDIKIELLNLKRDNEDSLALISRLENMLKNRLTADSISRYSELVQGYDNFSNSVTADLENVYKLYIKQKYD